jgi:hypothetical protein
LNYHRAIRITRKNRVNIYLRGFRCQVPSSQILIPSLARLVLSDSENVRAAGGRLTAALEDKNAQITDSAAHVSHGRWSGPIVRSSWPPVLPETESAMRLFYLSRKTAEIAFKFRQDSFARSVEDLNLFLIQLSFLAFPGIIRATPGAASRAARAFKNKARCAGEDVLDRLRHIS